MRKVTMRKSDLIEILEANKERHEKAFAEASKAFYERLVAKLGEWEQKVARHEMNYAELREKFNKLNAQHPQGHCDEYQEALDMLSYEVAEEVELQQHEFAQFVKDEWGWNQQFAASYTQNTGQVLGS